MAHTGMAFHSSLRVLLGLGLIILSSALTGYALLAVILILGSWLYLRDDKLSLRWIRRARYLLVIPPIFSGYAMAGSGILPWGLWVPTWEGLAFGSTQSSRLLAALLALRVALGGLSSSQLAEGFVGLFIPLGWFGLNVDQAARRLTLTLGYIDQLDGRKARDLLMGFHRIRPPTE